MPFLPGNRERLAGVQGAAMSPLVEAGCFETPARMPAFRSPPADAMGAFDYASCGAAARYPGLSFKTGGCTGPVAPAQLSKYAASPIRYGQPPGTVACPLG